MLKRLDELFHIYNGLASSQVTLLNSPRQNAVPYMRPAKLQQRTVAGWVLKSELNSKYIYPKHSVFVSTNGEGSHTYAYVSDFEFVANSDVCVLLSKEEMTLAEKIFYAKAITLNRKKFSYGRKPKGERLKSILLPAKAPDWVSEFEVKTSGSHIDSEKSKFKYSPIINTVALSELFTVLYGTNLELLKLTQSKNGINFVARTYKNNGVTAKVQKLHNVKPTEGMVLTVAGGGSVLETFLQIEPFYSGRDLYFLQPKIKMSIDEMLYYATCIKANQYKYSYGRQANKTLKDLRIPSFESIPAWVHGAYEKIKNRNAALLQND